jgi:unspecific monooxygenase
VVRLPYLNIVCKEMLRLSPVEIQTQPRIVSEEVEMEGYTLPKGTVVMPSIYLLHRREDLFPEPDKFKPERFLERQFTYFEYIPFGGGSRRCVGAAFAEFILKLVLTKILSSYDLRLTKTEVRPTLSGLNLMPSNGVPMQFIAKKKQWETSANSESLNFLDEVRILSK